MKNIFTIDDDIITEWEVTPNDIMPGWHILTEVDPSKKWRSICALAPGALDRDRYESVKVREEGYFGLENIVYYNSREEAEEVLNLKKQYNL